MTFLSFYPYIKIIHIISLISFMAGILYLPRLFVYHSMQKINSGEAKMLEIMEYKLIKYIVNPAFIFTFITGLMLSYFFLSSSNTGNYWIHGKFFLFLCMGAFHGFCSKYRKKFLISTNFRSTKFFRFFNEIPTILMILMVILVILKPF
jgi:putative membrane protein